MKPRADVMVAATGLLLLGLTVALIESRSAPPPNRDQRRSTLLHGPGGSAGLADALTQMGYSVERQRRRLSALLARPDSSQARPRALVLLDPTNGLGQAEGIAIAAWPVHRGDLLLAGLGADAAMACFGFRAFDREADSVRAVAPHGSEGGGTPWVSAVLARHLASEVVDSGDDALDLTRCVVPEMASAETLLVTPSGRAVAVRLHPVGYAGSVTLVADGKLFSNRDLRDTDAGVFALGLLAGPDSTIIFDERHHGFRPTGSLWGSTLAWSRESPWGWAAWQLAAVGLLVLLAGAVRFGPPRPLNDRRRRSALEHVTALATALSASQGHDTAIRLLVRGMGRRLSPDGRSRFDPMQLLSRLKPVLRTSQGRAALARLQSLTRPGQPAQAVRTAANAVEDVWQDLRP